MSKRVFVLEDDPSRIETIQFFWGNFADFDITSSYGEAIEKFNGEYNLIMLDHDLGGQIYVDIKESNTGTNFAKWLAKNCLSKTAPVIIHSHNPVGSMSMEEILIKGKFTQVASIPFGHLVKHWNDGTLNFLGNFKYDK
jgi:CheY-like chemotaxis protein